MILASLVLHNYLQEARHNVPPDLVDRDVNNGMIIAISWQHVGTEVDWENLNPIGRRPTQEAVNVQDTLCSYFNSEGKLPYQDAMIYRH